MAQLRYLLVVAALIGVVSVPLVSGAQASTPSIIDPSTDTVEATTLPTDNQPQMLGLDIPNARLLVTNYSQCTLEVFDLQTDQKLGPSNSVGHNPQGVAVDSAANVAYVANSVDNTVTAAATVGQNETPDPCANCRIYLPAVYRGQ